MLVSCQVQDAIPDFPRLRIVFKVTERTIEANGQQTLLVPRLEVDTYWISLLDAEAARVIELYHAHGTSEQFHSELKTDLDLERLPSGKFQTNELVLLLGDGRLQPIAVDRAGKPTGERYSVAQASVPPPDTQCDAGHDLPCVPTGETCTTVEVVLWKALSLV